MIDSVPANSENLVINKGEGVPSPPPSSPEITNSESSQAAVEVGLKGPMPETAKKSNARVSGTAKQTEEAMEDKLRETVEALNEKLNRLDREVLFKVDKKINKNYISVIDKQSQEVIREFPPKEIRTFIARFDEINEKLMVTPDVKSLIINLEV